jgi:hypothetical protein
MACCLALWPVVGGAEPNRGLWFWQSTTLPTGAASTHGSLMVVGDGVEEDAAIVFMTDYGIKRVFGSYGVRPVTQPLQISAWNAKLDAAGIDSQLLLDGNAVNDGAYMANFYGKIADRLIAFNNVEAPDEASKFDALHLDLEPQQLDLWKDDAVGTDKRALLTDLANAYAAIRLQLDTAGLSDIPIYADINFSWDKLPVDGGSVAWGGVGASEAAALADRNAWYAGIGASLEGLTIMTFSMSTALALADATDFERTGSFPGSVVVGIQPKTGVGELWADHTAFLNVMTQLESDVGTSEATDIENYGFLRHAVATDIPTLPALPFLEEIALPAGGGGVIVWGEAKPGYKYVLQETDDLSNPASWREVGSFTSPYPDRVERFEYQTATDADHCFWRVGRSKLP